MEIPCRECGKPQVRVRRKKVLPICDTCGNRIQAKRYRSNKSKKIILKKSKERYYKKHSKNVKGKSKKYYKQNQKARVEYARKRRELVGKELNKKRRENYKHNREKVIGQVKKNYTKNKKKIAIRTKIYRKKNIEKILIRNKNRHHRLRTLKNDSDIDNKYLAELFLKSIRCPLCNREYKNKSDKHLDHIIPIGVGGKHIKKNVRIICKTCNLSRPKDGRDIKSYPHFSPPIN